MVKPKNAKEYSRFCHTPDSGAAVWRGGGSAATTAVDMNTPVHRAQPVSLANGQYLFIFAKLQEVCAGNTYNAIPSLSVDEI